MSQQLYIRCTIILFVVFYYFAYQLTRAHKYFNISHGHMKLGENMDLKSHKEILQIYLVGQNVRLSYSVNVTKLVNPICQPVQVTVHLVIRSLT